MSHAIVNKDGFNVPLIGIPQDAAETICEQCGRTVPLIKSIFSDGKFICQGCDLKKQWEPFHFMKTLLTILALCVSLTACTTTQTGQKVVDPAVIQTISYEAAVVGVPLWLDSHPQDRPHFELARTSLRALLAAGDGTPDQLRAALAMLPIKQVQGEQGAVIVAGAVILIDAAGRQLIAQDSQHIYANWVRPIAAGLLQGLDAALAR